MKQQKPLDIWVKSATEISNQFKALRYLDCCTGKERCARKCSLFWTPRNVSAIVIDLFSLMFFNMKSQVVVFFPQITIFTSYLTSLKSVMNICKRRPSKNKLFNITPLNSRELHRFLPELTTTTTTLVLTVSFSIGWSRLSYTAALLLF